MYDMKFYIGIGGIGCSILSQYHRNHEIDKDSEFYYIDTQPITDPVAKNSFILQNAVFGTGTRRNIGRNIVNYEIYNGAMAEFFAHIKNATKVELYFVLSSFGGFGGAAVIPLIDYLEALSWRYLQSCTVYSFNENFLVGHGFPELLSRKFQLNTIEYTTEILSKEQKIDAKYCSENPYYPGCEAFLIDTQDIKPEDFWKCLDYSNMQLKEIDCKEKYRIRNSSKYEETPEVFISYSSKDQEIADKIADCFIEHNVKPWIASRSIKEGPYARQIMQGLQDAKVFLVIISKNSIASEHVKNEMDRAFSRIKEGMIIVPFIIDDAELDSECQYYLCRQEMFSGNVPPLEERIQELILRIRNVLKS